MNSKLYSPLIFEYSRTGRCGYMLPRYPFAQVDDIPTSLLRDLAADLPEVDVGSEVEIFGRRSDIYRLSAAAQTIPYELLCAVSKRVPRVYKDF